MKSPEQLSPSPAEQDEIKKTRTISDGELLKYGAEYKNGVLTPDDSQIKKIKEEMEVYFEKIKKQEEREEKINAIRKSIEEATNDPEKKELRRDLGEKMQDPRDLFRQEMIDEIALAVKMQKENPAFVKMIGNFFEYFSLHYLKSSEEATANGKDFQPDVSDLLLKSADSQVSYDRSYSSSGEGQRMVSSLADKNFRKQAEEFFENLIKNFSNLPLRQQLLKIDEFGLLLRKNHEIDFENPEEIEKYIKFYGNTEVSNANLEKLKENPEHYPVKLLKVSDGSYLVSDRGFKHGDLETVRKELVDNNTENYFHLIGRSRGCDDRLYNFPLIYYIALKSLEHEESSSVEICSGCGDSGCGLDYSLDRIAKGFANYKGQRVGGNGREYPRNEDLLKMIKAATGTIPNEKV